MTPVRLLPKALDDLVDIWDHIAKDSETNATRYIDRLHRHLDILSNVSGIGTARPDAEVPNVRGYPVGSHVIFYVTHPDRVEVLRIVHSARDMRKIRLQPPKDD